MSGHSDLFLERYAHVEAWLIQRLSEADIDLGGAVRVVSGESEKPETYTDSGQPVRPYTETAAPAVIDSEESRLLTRGRDTGIFWELDQVRCVISAARKLSGGREHDVYQIAGGEEDIIIRSTINDSFGFAGRSPAQYLGRLRDYNYVFPELQTRLIGVSLNERGNGVIWTVQPFVEGAEFKALRQLTGAMTAAGYKRISGVEERFIHDPTGIILNDVHPGNVLHRAGELYPVDVIVENLRLSLQSIVPE
jgi:hypothetical protein